MTSEDIDNLEEEDQQAVRPQRAPVLLALMRIISVLAMSFAIAFGLFLLLWGKILLGLVSIVIAVPFFVAMRYMEKHALAEE